MFEPGEAVRYLQTLALPTLKYALPKTQVSTYFYYQFEKDVFDRSTWAYDLSVHITHTLTENKEKGSKYTATAGFELLSGTPTSNQQSFHGPLVFSCNGYGHCNFIPKKRLSPFLPGFM